MTAAQDQIPEGFAATYARQAATYDRSRSAGTETLEPLLAALADAPGRQVLDVGGGTNHIVVAGVAAMHILDEAVINPERCHIDTARLKIVGRMQSPGGYVRTTDTFKLKQMDFAAWRAARG